MSEAAEIFGATTKVATANAAAEEDIKRRKRASFPSCPNPAVRAVIGSPHNDAPKSLA